MPVKLVIALNAPNSALATGAYDAGAVIQLQSATDEAFTTPADVARIDILADTYIYEYWDADGALETWYRWRLENTGDTLAGAWSDPFQGWDPAQPRRNVESYATLDDLLLHVSSPRPGDRSTDRTARYLSALREGRDRIDELVGTPGMFFRSPQTGADEVRIYDGTDDDVLHVHSGIVELTGIRVRFSSTGDWVDVDLGDVALEYWANSGDPHNPPSSEPYDHVVFTGLGTYVLWPDVRRGVELTGAFGWPAPPTRAIAANVDAARQALAADSSFAGGIVGPDVAGAPVGAIRLPQSVYELRNHMLRRQTCDI